MASLICGIKLSMSVSIPVSISDLSVVIVAANFLAEQTAFTCRSTPGERTGILQKPNVMSRYVAH